MKHLRLIEKLFKSDRAFILRSKLKLEMLFFLGEGKTGAPAEKTLPMELEKDPIR